MNYRAPICRTQRWRFGKRIKRLIADVITSMRSRSKRMPPSLERKFMSNLNKTIAFSVQKPGSKLRLIKDFDSSVTLTRSMKPTYQSSTSRLPIIKRHGHLLPWQRINNLCSIHYLCRPNMESSIAWRRSSGMRRGSSQVGLNTKDECTRRAIVSLNLRAGSKYSQGRYTNGKSKSLGRKLLW